MKLLIALAVLCAGADAVAAQSLGEVARREEERRKSIAASGKVYTSEALREQPPAPGAAAPVPDAGNAAAAPSASQGQAQAGAAPAAPADQPRRDEAYWKQRIQAERDALARSQVFADALQTRINSLTADFTARDDPAQRAVLSTDRQKALAELDRVKQEIQQHTKAIADIQEEGRRAGAPAGWLR